MSAIDYAAVLADLRRRVAELQAAIAAIAAIVPLVAEASPAPVDRTPRSVADILAERKQRDEAIIGEVRRKVDGEVAQRAKQPVVTANGGPGKGRKSCPNCHIVLGARQAQCDCGHRFGRAE